MAELLRDDLVATDVFRTLGFVDVYSSVLDDLAVCGFDETADPPTLYAYPYDALLERAVRGFSASRRS
jgi:hypothetical protein